MFKTVWTLLQGQGEVSECVSSAIVTPPPPPPNKATLLGGGHNGKIQFHSFVWPD